MALTPGPAGQVNNDLYHALGERWYSAQDDPVALLRAESRMRNPWIAAELGRAFPMDRVKVLDVGCGAGFLANYLAQRGVAVTGLDASAESLMVARAHDVTGRVHYETGDAYALPYAAASFQAVCAMDFLEHVDDPRRVIAECARVLQPGGLFFFATFNRNPIAWLVAIKGVEWFVKNTPPRLHQLRCFIKPAELRGMCADNGLRVAELRGSVPKLTRAFWRMLLTGEVSDEFAFQFSRSTLTGYLGMAVKGIDGLQRQGLSFQ
ncbi:MAG: 3-demethylubiquinone-9 3-O-methyltransferase [Acidobacteria bacterium]|nr:3-demethylubiquinone-9 3-O-methyltransferase [Acidobacteriota bacterium]MBI3422443.1 3-demethylubiquinone-9 3-O-methyltransferase [Acidobacteriota bacterium]